MICHFETVNLYVVHSEHPLLNTSLKERKRKPVSFYEQVYPFFLIEDYNFFLSLGLSHLQIYFSPRAHMIYLHDRIDEQLRQEEEHGRN